MIKLFQNKYKQFIFYINLIRFNKPIGFFLLLWPTLDSLLLSGRKIPEVILLMIFIFGTFLMRSAGCIINDIIDIKLDSKVQRTKFRPLPTGNIKKKQAFIFFMFFILISFFLIFFNLNKKAVYLCVVSFVFTCIYPFMKRYFLPQIFLGITFSLSIPISWLSNINTVNIDCLLLFLANFFWIIAYDTQYAMIDMADDIKINIKSTAVLFKNFSNNIFISIFQIVTLFILIFLGIKANLNFFYWNSIVIMIILFSYQQIVLIKNNDYLKAFLNNNYIGVILFLGFLLNIQY